jgi:hypothetical protein
MTLTTVLILCFLLGVGVVIPAWIGAEIAARFGRNRSIGFVLGGIGAVGGWMLSAIRLGNGSRPQRTLIRALNGAYVVSGAMIACLNAVYLGHVLLAVAAPKRFGTAFVEMFGPSASTTLGWSVAGWTAWASVLLLWLFSWAVLLRDQSVPRNLRRRWIVGLALFVGALAYAPWQQRTSHTV